MQQPTVVIGHCSCLCLPLPGTWDGCVYPKLAAHFFGLFPVHLELVIEIVLCLPSTVCPWIRQWWERQDREQVSLGFAVLPPPRRAGTPGSSWSSRRWLGEKELRWRRKELLHLKQSFSFILWTRHVLCGFNLTISLPWLPSSKGISSVCGWAEVLHTLY